MGASSVGEPETSSSLGVNNKVSNVFGLRGGCQQPGWPSWWQLDGVFSYMKMHKNSVPG